MRFLFLFFLIVSFSGCKANPFDELKSNIQQLDTELNHTILRIEEPGALFSKSGNKSEEDSLYMIGSLTKQMTAYMTLRILEEFKGQANLQSLLDQPLKDVFLGSSFLQSLNPKIQGVSLIELLTHRSGIPDFIEFYDKELDGRKKIDLNSPLNLTDLINALPYDESKEYAYSNTAYMLVAQLLEELTGQSYQILFEQYIKGPAQLISATAPVLGNYHDLKQKNEYQKLVSDLNDQVFFDMANAKGAGNVISNILDLSRWHHFFYKQMPNHLRDIILKDYGQDSDGDTILLGMARMSSRKGNVTGWQGGIDSYKSWLFYLDKYDTTLIILSNSLPEFSSVLSLFEQML